MTNIAQRNRQIKKLLKQAFAPHSVSVTGDRGTAYGWVQVKIGYAPRDNDEWRDLRSKVLHLIKAAGIELGHYYDDMGGRNAEILIDFERCRDRQAA